MKNIINIVVKDLENSQRLDLFISKEKKELSRNRVKNLILNKKLKLNEKIIEDPSKKISNGDVLKLELPEPENTFIKPFDYKLDIVYEDNDLLVLNKPAGITIHPGAGNIDNTIVNALINYPGLKLSNIGDKLRPGIVHRIDKDTSGLIVIAKNNFTHENLSLQFKNHTIERIYLALIWGKLRPQNGKIETFITRSSKNRQLMEVSLLKGKKAITHYKTIEIFENDNVPTLSFIECKIETGRTHQIRVHMSYKGNNIIGDKKYKKRFKNFKNIDPKVEKSILELNRQFLHAKVLGFDHPKNNKTLKFSSKLPQELNNVLKKLRNTKK